MLINLTALRSYKKELRPRLVKLLNNSFSVFKQHYTHFYTLFHPHVFKKTTNNITQTSSPNSPKTSECVFAIDQNLMR